MSTYRGYTLEQSGAEDRPQTDIFNPDGHYRATIPEDENSDAVRIWIDRDIRNRYIAENRHFRF